jgi:hypothetical protein
MSIVTEKEEVVVALKEQETSEKNRKSLSRIGEVDFLWKLMVSTQAGAFGKWRVQMTLQSGGVPVRSFTSDPLEVEFDQLATMTFPMTSGTDVPDSFWVERFESVRSTATEERRDHAIPKPEVQFTLLPDATGTKPQGILITNTNMTIFWIIGARNIVLTEIN